VTDFLDEKRQEITARLKELKPLVEEYQRLEAAASALDGVGGASATAARSSAAPPATATRKTGRRGPGRPRGSKTKTTAAKAAPAATTSQAAAPAKRGGARRKAGRRKGSGTRAAQALSFVQSQPGITIPELAARMGIKQNYLYRVLPSLEEEGKVAKQGRGWHPKG
jgi:ribosomal protein S25